MTTFDVRSARMEEALLDAEIFRVASLTAVHPPSEGEATPPFECERILVAVQPSPGSTETAWARELAFALHAEVGIVHVATEFASSLHATGLHGPTTGTLAPLPLRAIPAEHQEATARVLEEAAAELSGLPEPPRTLAKAGPHAGEGILQAAEEFDADLIVLGQGTRGIDRILIGSTADFVKDHANRSVLIAKRPPGRGNVLLPVDGSLNSRAAGRAAYRLARALDKEIDLLHVIPPGLAGGPAGAAADGPPRPTPIPRVRTYVRTGDARDVTVGFARELDHDLIVMGTRGLTGIRRLLVGSVSNYVSHAAKTSILLVPEVGSA